jgi:hypothetical protein
MSSAEQVEDRFWSKVDKSGECWVWTGCRTRSGYGRFNFRGRVLNAQRACWEIVHGPVAAELFVCHRCDNPPCVNPAHLFLGTPADNVADKIAKGRAADVRGARHPRARLNRSIIESIRAAALAGSPPRRVAAQFGVSPSTVDRARRGVHWALQNCGGSSWGG